MLVMQRPKVEALSDDGDRQLFAVGPLEPGFGHTLGNSCAAPSHRPRRSPSPPVRLTNSPPDYLPSTVLREHRDVVRTSKDRPSGHSDEAVTLRIDVRVRLGSTGDIVDLRC